MTSDTIRCDAGVELLITSMERHAFVGNGRIAVLPVVPCVFGCAALSQIFAPVIQRIAVFVIDENTTWPLEHDICNMLRSNQDMASSRMQTQFHVLDSLVILFVERYQPTI